jgi:hypothetical protein
MDWSSRVCFATNFTVTRGAQTGRLGGEGTAWTRSLTGRSSLNQGKSGGIQHTEMTGNSIGARLCSWCLPGPSLFSFTPASPWPRPTAEVFLIVLPERMWVSGEAP